MLKKLIFSEEQKKVIFNKSRGVSKITGIAGSGKSLVAVRRAIQLALEDKESKILFLFFNKSLKKEIEESFKYFSEYKEVEQRIKIINIDSFTWGFLKNYKELKDKVIKNNCEEEFIAPFSEFEKRKLIKRIEFSISYIRNTSFQKEDATFLLEEIEWIRNSMLDEKEYISSDRLGRGHKVELNNQKKREVLEILKLYRKRPLEEKYFHDYLERLFYLVNNFTEISLEKQYEHLVIDEAQDLSRLQLEFIKLICPISNIKNSISFFLDSNQSIYTNKAWIVGTERNFKQIGFNIEQKNIFELAKTYRNVDEIYTAANKLLQEKVLKKHKSLSIRFSDENGIKPFFVKYSNEEDEFRDLCKNIKSIIEQYNYNFSDITIISPYSKKMYDRLVKFFPVTKNNEEPEKINITTFESSKGTENKVVFVTGLNRSSFPSSYIYPDKNDEEIIEQGKKLLYVAMTRSLEILVLSTYSERTKIFDFFDSKDFIFVKNNEDEDFLFLLNSEIHRTNIISNENERYKKIIETKKEEERIVEESKRISEGTEIEDLKKEKINYPEKIARIEMKIKDKLPLIHKETLEQLIVGEIKYSLLLESFIDIDLDFSSDSLPFLKALENEFRICYSYLRDNGIPCNQITEKTFGSLLIALKSVKELYPICDLCYKKGILETRNKIAHEASFKLEFRKLKEIKEFIVNDALKKISKIVLKLRDNYGISDEKIITTIKEKGEKLEYKKENKPYFVYFLENKVNAVSVNNYEIGRTYKFVGRYISLGGAKYFEIEKIIKL